MRYLLFAVSILSMAVISFGELYLKYQWKYIDFVWENENQKAEALRSGQYNASAIMLFDVDQAPDDRVFVTLIRDKGVPVSVATISKQQGKGGPLLRPYPNWSWYRNCTGITGGVYQLEWKPAKFRRRIVKKTTVEALRIRCNHLFMVDAGSIGNNLNQLCPPQLLIFDLATDKLVKRVLIPTSIAHNKIGLGLLTSIYVYSQNCTNIKDNAIILMADTDGVGLVVYNPQIPKLCRIETESMKHTDPVFTIENQYFVLNDGIFSLVLINKDLYYAALAGSKIYKIEVTKDLLRCMISDSEALKQTQLASALSGQTATLASDNCAIFFNNIADCTILCADTTKPINSKNNTEIIVRDPKRLQFISGLKSRNDKLLILSNRYHKHIYDTLDINEVNFHIFWMLISEIKKGTKCFTGCNKKLVYG